MNYMKVIWKHDFIDEPVELYSELDDYGNEIRKVEIYKNGMIGYATSEFNYNNTLLSKHEIPKIEDINRDEQFRATSIDKCDFETIWSLTQNGCNANS